MHNSSNNSFEMIEFACDRCVGDAWMFYTNVLRTVNVTDIPRAIHTCPTGNLNISGQRYTHNNPFSPANITWSWHPAQVNEARAQFCCVCYRRTHVALHPNLYLPVFMHALFPTQRQPQRSPETSVKKI